jgi:hypothetical protein
MRRRTRLSIALILGLIASINLTPVTLAMQGEDQESDFADIAVTCDGEQCNYPDDADPNARRNYEVVFLPTAYVPERAYPEALVVKVIQGELAFRVQSDDVIVDPQGDAGDEQGIDIPLLETTDPVPFGQPPSTLSPLPVYNDTGTSISDADCSRPPLQGLCLLPPELFADQQTFIELSAGDIVYLPAGSTCFFCNVSGAVVGDPDTEATPAAAEDQIAEVQVWGVRSFFSWDSNSPSMASGTPTAQGQDLQNIRAWRFNPGSPCH